RERPDFALAVRAGYLLGSAYREQGRDRDAEQSLLDLLTRHPRSAWVASAEQMLAEILLARREYARARGYYSGLRRHPDPMWQVVAEQGGAMCDREQRRRHLAIAAMVYLLLGGGLLLLRGRRHLWPPPFEVCYYLPVAGLLCLVALIGVGGVIGR